LIEEGKKVFTGKIIHRENSRREAQRRGDISIQHKALNNVT